MAVLTPLLLMVSTAVRLLTRMVSCRLAMWDCTLMELVGMYIENICVQILRTKHTVKKLPPLISNALCMSKGAVTVGASLQFDLIDPGSFRLLAITSGGPPTTFSWRGPNGVLSNADSTVTVLNGSTSTVQLELRVTGNVPGEYTFAATNSRTTGDVTSTLTVTGTHTHTHTHTHATVHIFAPHTVRAPDPPVVTLTGAMATGVTVGWNSQGGVDSYEVLYNRTTGSAQQGACPDFVNMGSATATGGDTSLTLQNLEEFSNYTITVIAMNRIASVSSTAVEFMTPSAGTIIVSNSQGIVLFSMSFPTAPSPPSVALVNSTNTTIAVSWAALRCIDQNSQFTIVNYTVRYGRESGSERTQVLVPGTSTAFTVSILEPGTRYSIEVAAVNSNGETGEFSEPVVESTSGTTCDV